MRTSRSNMRRLRAGLIGSISAWLPSRRSTAHHIGATVDDAVGPGAVKWNGQRCNRAAARHLFSEGAVAADRHRRAALGVPSGWPWFGGADGLLMVRADEKASGESGEGLENVVTVCSGSFMDSRPAHREHPRREAGLIRPRRGCREGAPAARDHCSKVACQAKTPGLWEWVLLDLRIGECDH